VVEQKSLMKMTTKYRTVYPPSAAGIWSKCPYSCKLAHYLEVDRTLSFGPAERGRLVHQAFAEVARGLSIARYEEDIQKEVQELLTLFNEEVVINYLGRERMIEGDKLTTFIHPKGGDTIRIRGQIDILFTPFRKNSTKCVHGNFAVFDIKTGRVPVYPHDNPQLLIYADMVLRRWPHIMESIKSIDLGILQQPYNKVKKTTITLDFLLHKLETLYTRLVNANYDAPRSGPHCHYCKVKDWCSITQTNLRNLMQVF